MNVHMHKGVKYFGTQDIFRDVNFDIKDNEKIAIVGRNGCGKTTLLRVISQQERLDDGEITFSKDIEIGYLTQTTFFDETKTLKEEYERLFDKYHIMEKELQELTKQLETSPTNEKLLSRYATLQEKYERAGGYMYETELHMLVTKFGFELEDLNRTVDSFSGGQKTRLSFIKLLLSKPDLILLDEPTNHLDLETIEWLEGYLKFYEKAMVIVSHDRVFLDSVATTIYDLEYGTLTKYTGNYSSFVEQKKKNTEIQNRAYARQQKEIARLEALIEKYRYKATKASFAQSKEKYLDRMEKVQEVKHDESSFRANFVPAIRGGEQVLILENLEIGYDSVLSTVSFELRRQNRMAILGPNGIGKSTLLKTIMDIVPSLGGEKLFGHQIQVGYFDQELAQFSSHKTVLEEVWDDYPSLTQTQIRQALGSFLFTGDDAFKSVSVLSGGEKVRLTFVKLMLQKANLLVLDEPTNHLDIMGKDALEDMLLQYEGTILFVSHDRYFISKIANRILEMDETESKVYDLTYAEFMEKKQSGGISPTTQRKVDSATKRMLDNKTSRRIDKLEKEMTNHQKKIEELKTLQFEKEVYEDVNRMKEIEEELQHLQLAITKMEEEWMELHE